MAKSTQTLRRQAAAKRAREAASAGVPSAVAGATPSPASLASSSSNKNVTPPPRKRGRPKKPLSHQEKVKFAREEEARASASAEQVRLATRSKLRGRASLPSIAEEDESPGTDEVSPIVGRRIISKIAVPSRKGPRSNPSKPTRAAKPVDRYVAEPACLSDRTGQSPWTKSKSLIHNLTASKKTLEDNERVLRLELYKSHAGISELNKKLLAKNQMGDSRPMSHSPPAPFETSDLKAFAKAALKSNSQEVSDVNLVSVLSALGLDKDGRVTKRASKASFVKGIRTLVDFHFSNYDENEHADIMGELLFNGNFFSKDASNKASEKITRTLASCIFNAVQLLKAIDMKAGSSNDSSIDEYAKIERDVGLTSPPQGKSILRPRHNITRARKIADGLVSHLFTIDDSHSPLVECNYDQVSFDPERLFRFTLDVFKLKEKALRGNLKFGWAGDAAAVCTSTNNASQSLFGMKIIDTDAINPLTKEPLLCSYIVNEEEDDATKRVFHGAQSNVCCMVSCAVMAKEKEAMKSESFKCLINFVKKVEREGLPANGDEPAIPRQKDRLVGCGDLSFHQKVSDLGGACKVKRFFCTYCSTMSGDHDLLGYVSGILVCDMCKRNGRETCAHVRVDDDQELVRKGRELVTLLLVDNKGRLQTLR